MDFKILWIDDEPSWVDSIISEVEEFISARAFFPVIERHEDGSKICEFIDRADIELIIIDFNLEENETGAHLVDQIRRKGNFVEILFYSQDPTAVAAEFQKQNEYVHCVTREDVKEEIFQLIEFSVYKHSNLGFMRGMVIAEAIDIENTLDEIILRSFGSHREKLQTALLQKLGPAFDFYKKFMFVQSRLKAHIKLLNRIDNRSEEEIRKLDILKNCERIVCGYKNDIVVQRNILAHAKRERDENGDSQLCGLSNENQKIVVSREWMTNMRSTLVKYRMALNEIICEELLVDE